MSKKVTMVCDICSKECKGHYWGGGYSIFAGEVFQALDYIGWRLMFKGKTIAKLKGYGNGRWYKLEICNECQKDMFNWVIAKKLGVDK